MGTPACRAASTMRLVGAMAARIWATRTPARANMPPCDPESFCMSTTITAACLGSGSRGQGKRERHDGGEVSLQVVRGIHHRPAHEKPRQPDADGHPDSVVPCAGPDGGREGQGASVEDVTVTDPDLFLICRTWQPDMPAGVPYPLADQDHRGEDEQDSGDSSDPPASRFR